MNGFEGNTTIMENQLVKVSEAAIGGETVNSVDARELHEFLKVDTRFDIWFSRRIEDYGFTLDLDFCSFLIESSGGRPKTEYAVSMDMAKELSMVERNEKGKQARKYFIAMERKAKGITTDSRRPEQLDLGYIALGHLKKHLSMSDVSYLGCAKKLHDDLGVSTAMLPQYVENVRVTFSATELLNRKDYGLKIKGFNKLMIEKGFLEIKKRKGSAGKTKEFKALTDLGLQYGNNDQSPQSPLEVQPHYFEDCFPDLVGRVAA